MALRLVNEKSGDQGRIDLRMLHGAVAMAGLLLLVD
jgi:hypothetical protein